MYWGGLTSEPLDPGGARKARRKQVEDVCQTGEYQKVPASEARTRRRDIWGVPWADVKKAVGKHRSRLVAKYIETHKAADLFATPSSRWSTYFEERRMTAHKAPYTSMSHRHSCICRRHRRRPRETSTQGSGDSRTRRGRQACQSDVWPTGCRTKWQCKKIESEAIDADGGVSPSGVRKPIVGRMATPRAGVGQPSAGRGGLRRNAPTTTDRAFLTATRR